jgi:hypothetical protein
VLAGSATLSGQPARPPPEIGICISTASTDRSTRVVWALADPFRGVMNSKCGVRAGACLVALAEVCGERIEPVRLEFAFPDDEDTPAKILQPLPISLVAFDVPVQLRFPELRPRPGSVCEPAAGMTVPEAAVDEHNRPVTGQDDVGLPGQIPHVQPVAKATGMEMPPNHQFGLRVTPADPGHHAAAGGGVHDVGHGS